MGLNGSATWRTLEPMKLGPVDPRRGGVALVTVLQVATVLVMVAAVMMRGVQGRARKAPNLREQPPELVAPLQLLSEAADMRLGELAPLLDIKYRDDWIDAYRIPFLVQGCPDLDDWIPTTEGQQVERLIGELRRAGPEEAFASLVLVFQVARATEWEPGLLGRTQNAERMGQYVQDWLTAWAERGAEDPLLFEPTIAATLLYARIMRTAYDAPAIGHNAGPYNHAKQFLERLTGARQPLLTAYGEALSTQLPVAFQEFLERDDFLRGFEREAKVRYAKIDGECDQ